MSLVPPPPDAVVVARGLTKRFGERTVVCGIDLTIPRGGCFGLLGPNGAGKTTTLRMILGQSPMSGGTLSVLGLPMPAAIREIHARTGVVPQSDNQDPDFTVVENLRMYARYFGLRPAQVAGRIDELLGFLELSDRRDALMRELSGGMKRRLSIARALINDPEFIMLDEPTTGLDPQVRHLIWTRLRKLKTSGKTLLLTTHYMDEAERLCDQLVVIDRGRIVTQGSPRGLIEQHVEPHVIEVQGEAGSVVPVLGNIPGARLLTVGETHYCYASELGPVLARLETVPQLRYTHRTANLEDVFLKLTGHELRE
ncbi:MAG: ATP-binding cassette domain-containing protein [Gammaproteobacteria bacterium]|jgi:lipooligosaccharide transport system ATP-binding protein|nr:ATP-binding cassette domain-containing protein [Gammaproteobacteria bacterium]